MSLKTKSIAEILNLFQDYLKTNEAQDHLKAMEKEKVDVQALMNKLSTLDQNDPEFVELVLFGLIPHSKTKAAKRVSHLPAVFNIKSYLKWLNYSDEDWKKIADLIYTTVSNFQKNPENLEHYTEEYAQNPYSKSMQCGTISPILFAINDSYPLVNNPVKRTYQCINKLLGHPDSLGSQMKDYPENVIKLEKFVNEINSDLLRKNDQLDLFCYWFDNNTHYAEKAQKRKTQKNDGVSEPEEELKKINLPEFIQKIEFDKIGNLEHNKVLHPETRHINEIISYVEDTHWVLPHFQRYFDWKKDDIKEFLRAIFNDYYVGAFLLWDAHNKEPELGLLPIQGIEKDSLNGYSIILDGQQRITSLTYAITCPNNSNFVDKTKWEKTGIYKEHPIYYYIDFKEFFSNPTSTNLIKTRRKKLTEKECFDAILFPFYELKNYDKWLMRFESYSRKLCNDSDKIFQLRNIMSEKLSTIWKDFEIPYITLPNKMGINQVTEIFEQLNTKGKPLSVFDLLIARSYKYNIDLKGLWDQTRKQYHERIFRYSKRIEKIPIYILQSISLVYDKNSSAKRSDILDIYKNIYQKNPQYDFKNHWNEMAEHLDRALERLENFRANGFGVRNEKELPFAPMIPVLTALLRLIDEQQNKNSCFEKLNKWYWSSIFSNSYSSAADTQMTTDYKEMKNWFKDDTRVPKTVREMIALNIYKINLHEVKTQSNAQYKGVMSLLAIEGSKDFATGQTLENARENDKDHIFPRAIREALNRPRSINSVLNMSWMSKATNRTIKKFEKPSSYIRNFIETKYGCSEKQFEEVLKTHMIDKNAYDAMKKDDFNQFLIAREQIILLKIASLLGIQNFKKSSSGMVSPYTPFSNKKVMWDTLRTCEGHIHWIDKYFSKAGLETIIDADLDPKKVQHIRILMGPEKVNDKFKKLFRKFKEELANKNISCELRVIMDPKIKSDIHDRWVLGENCAFNVASVDVIARGQYCEIKKTSNSPPFDEWWKNSKDIFNQ